MTARDRYRTAAAFRAALEQRLRTEGHATGVPLNRLRKEAAFHRLLARLHRAAPDLWALKGGQALIARLGIEVRATKDADANWRATRHELEEALTAVEDLDLDDWFTFQIGDAHSLQGEGDHGALRYSVIATLDGRAFEHLSLDINIVGPNDVRPVEIVRTRRNPFAFVDELPLEIPMVPPAQQLAEKLHAYTRLYQDEQTSSRAKDLFDMVVIADQVELPNVDALTAATRQTFSTPQDTLAAGTAAPAARVGTTMGRLHRRLSTAVWRPGQRVHRAPAILDADPHRNLRDRGQLATRRLEVELVSALSPRSAQFEWPHPQHRGRAPTKPTPSR